MARGVQVGDKAPDFTLPAQSGEPVRLQSRLGERVVMGDALRGEVTWQRWEQRGQTRVGLLASDKHSTVWVFVD